MEQQNSWEHLMAAAEGIASRFLYAGPSPQRVEGDIVELMQHCPGFKDHEYRQAYWQGVQNLKQRTDHTFATDGDLLASQIDAHPMIGARVEHTAFDAGL